MSIVEILLMVFGLYCMCLSLVTNTVNLAYSIAYKIIPFFGGCLCLVPVLPYILEFLQY